MATAMYSGGPFRVLVVGLGGTGGLLAAGLAAQGHDVFGITRQGRVADAVEADGFATRGFVALGSVRGRAATAVGRREDPFDFVLLAVPGPLVAQAAQRHARHLALEGRMVVFANGGGEATVAQHVGVDRTLGCIATWTTGMPAPGVYEQTSASASFILGRVTVGPAEEDPWLRGLSVSLEALGPVATTDDLTGARRTALVLDSALTVLLTTGDRPLGDLMYHRFARRLALELVSEAAGVAQTRGASLPRLDGTPDLHRLRLAADDLRSGDDNARRRPDTTPDDYLRAVGRRYLRTSPRRSPDHAANLLQPMLTAARAVGMTLPVHEAFAAALRAGAVGLDTLERVYLQSQPADPPKAPAGDTNTLGSTDDVSERSAPPEPQT
ncbi:MAG: 2-dehydropantoate 2-reductase N-terminal domain-containing protein [Myxococcota bacterium]